MSFEVWAAFCVTEAVLCFTPGPAVLLVASMSLGRGTRPAFGASLGIVASNTLYFALSATGVAAALVASRELFLVIKWAGAVYLVWLGLRMLLAKRGPDAVAQPVALARCFVRGFLVQGANPKALLFFIALLPVFIDPAGSIAHQVLILGVSSVLIELAALRIIAQAAERARRAVGEPLSCTLERIGGGLLVAVGVRLATARPE